MPPPTIEEMRNALLAQLYENRSSLKGVALVQGLKALAQLVQQEKAEPEKEVDDRRVSVLDRLDALPPAHAVQLIEQEIVRLEEALAAHRLALEETKGLI